MEMFDKKNELNSPNFVVRLVLFCFLIFHLKVSFSVLFFFFFVKHSFRVQLVSFLHFYLTFTLWMYQRVTWG